MALSNKSLRTNLCSQIFLSLLCILHGYCDPLVNVALTQAKPSHSRFPVERQVIWENTHKNLQQR